MGDEGGGVAVLGGDFDLLVDHGAFLLAGGWPFLGSRFGSTAMEGGQDKATWRVGRRAGVELLRPDRHCLGDLTAARPTGDFSDGPDQQSVFRRDRPPD